jgi:leucyl/phenylalanyl-tRNA--protein transferase
MSAAWFDPEFILEGYRRGCFPMADSREGAVRWYEADPRGVIPLDAPHVPRRLRRYMKRFTFTVDQAFERVIDGCARPRTWISREIREAYLELHRLGHVHSVEAWQDGELAGGLYGVHLRGAFMAESMFHVRDNGSGAALATLIDRLRERGFRLLDIQEITPTTARYGGVWIPKAEYHRRLAEALQLDVRW